jgi:hypothetical protein
MANCSFPDFGQLDAEQQRLLKTIVGGADLFDNKNKCLSDKQKACLQKACFLNLTAALAWVGIRTNRLKLKPLTQDDSSGIQEDRLKFAADPDAIKDLYLQVQTTVANRVTLDDKGFKSDKPRKSEHPGMSSWGARQWVTTASLQIGAGPEGAFVDIDEFGALTDIVGFLGHIIEVLRNKTQHRKTNPIKIGKKLRHRGIDTKYSCE